MAGDVGRRPGDGAGIEVHKVSTQGWAATFYLDHAGSVNYPAVNVHTEGYKPAIYATHGQSNSYGYLASASYGVCGSAGTQDGYGVYGTAWGTNGHAVEAVASGSDGYAAIFSGNVARSS